jgi:hypothetical protein
MPRRPTLSPLFWPEAWAAARRQSIQKILFGNQGVGRSQLTYAYLPSKGELVHCLDFRYRS